MSHHGYAIMFSVNNKHSQNVMCQIVTPSPAMMHMLDKPGSCGKFENYQRPEGFPVGTCGHSNSNKKI